MTGVRNAARTRGRAPVADSTEIRRLIAVARPWLAGAVAVGLGQALLLVAQAAVLSRLLATALYGGLTASAAVRASAAIGLLAAGQGLGGWAWEAWTESGARRARSATRRQAVARAVRLAAAGRCDPGRMATLIGAGVDELDPLVARVVPRTVLALAVPALLLAWIGHLDLVSAGLAGLAVALSPVLAGLVGAQTAGAVRHRLASLERLGARFAALIEGLPLLRAFGRAEDHERAVAASGEDVRAATLATLRVALLSGLVLELLAAVGTALVAVRLGLRLDAGQHIFPQALAVLMLTPELFVPLRRLTSDFHAAATGRATLASLGELAAADRSPAASEIQGRPGRPRPGPLGVVLEGVSLAVPGRSDPVLDGIDLRICPGERICLVGESGAGKSCLLRIVAGLVPPSAGRALIEGQDIRTGRSEAIGWVPQHPVVLPASILDNVALGRPGVDESIASAALEAAELGDWLKSRRLGLRTPLSELDAPLSLGERRRLAIARNLAGPRPRLWLLDEPTAGLDLASSERLAAALGLVIGGATAIIASHDPSARILARRQVELRRGRITGTGDERTRHGRDLAFPAGAR